MFIKDERSLNQSAHRTAFAYWRTRCEACGGDLPGRRDINPTDLKSVLAMVGLIDVIRGDFGLRYHHRLVGTRMAVALGEDPTGGWLDQRFSNPHRRHAILAMLDGVVVKARPYLSKGDVETAEARPPAGPWLYLPLAADGASVDMLLAIVATRDEATL